MLKKILLPLLLATNVMAAQPPEAPTLYIDNVGKNVNVKWNNVPDVMGYRLLYAKYPYGQRDKIGVIDMGMNTNFNIDLWEGVAYYVAVVAYDKQGTSDYSNIGFLQIRDRGEAYRDYWRNVKYNFQGPLYDEKPIRESCFAGVISPEAKDRLTESLNQTRLLHNEPPVVYEYASDKEVQDSAMMQWVNGYLSHYPYTRDECYTEEAASGARSSNILSGSTGDPARDVMRFMDDSNNISNIYAVGHRRWLISPFSKFTAYGQVYGKSTLKVFRFPDGSVQQPEDIPDYVAYPYMRYPHVLISHKAPWSLSIVENKHSAWGNQHEYFTNSNINVTEKGTGRKLIVGNVYQDTSGVGVPNIISWDMKDWEYDTWYVVRVSNIHYQSGDVRELSYDVYIDYKNLK